MCSSLCLDVTLNFHLHVFLPTLAGVIITFLGFSRFFSLYLVAGYLRDKMGDYDMAFYLAGVPPIIGGALLCLIPWVEAKRKRREKKEALKGEQEATQKMMEHEKAQEDVQHKAGDSVL